MTVRKYDVYYDIIILCMTYSIAAQPLFGHNLFSAGPEKHASIKNRDEISGCARTFVYTRDNQTPTSAYSAKWT